MPTHAILPVKHLHDSKRRLAHLLSADERADLIGRFLDNLLLTLSATPGINRTLVVTCDPAVVRLARRRGADVLLEAAADGLNTAAARGAAHAAAQGATAVLLLPADLPFARVTDIEAMLRPLEQVPGSRFQVPGKERSSLAPGPWPLAPSSEVPGEEAHAKAQRSEGAKEAEQASSSLPLRLGPLAPWRESSSLAPGPWPLAPLLAVCPDETEDGTNALLLAPPGDFTFRYGPGSFRAHLAEADRHGRAAHVIPAPGLRFDLDTESDWLVYNGYLVGVGEE